MKKHWSYSEDFVANINDHKCLIWLNLRNIDVSLLLRRWSLMILWRDIFGTLINSMETFLVFIVFVVLNTESLMFHGWFIDDTLMILWKNIDVTAKISMQALIIFKGFIDRISETLMFHFCFVDESLMTFWRDIIETLINSMETFWIFIVFVVLNFESLMFHCSISDDSLRNLWRNIDDTTKIWTQTLKINEVSNVIIFRT